MNWMNKLLSAAARETFHLRWFDYTIYYFNTPSENTSAHLTALPAKTDCIAV